MALLSQQRKSLNRKFEQIMLKFSLKEVRENVLTLFEDLTWDIVVKAINKYNLSTRKDDVAKLIVEYMKNFTIEDTRVVYGNLLVTDLILHHKNKTWTAVSMREPDEVTDDEECAGNILKSFRKLGKTISVYSERADDIRWLVLIIYRKTKNGGMIHQNPIFVAHPPSSNFLFFTPKPDRINVDTMKAIVTGFGYEEYKISKLTGRNLHSLGVMLSRKKDAEKIRVENERALMSVENQPVYSAMGINFCKNEMRIAHAKQMFGDENVELQTLTVNFDSEWRGVRTLPQANGRSFNYTMKLKSKNVRKILELMVQNGNITEPYPIWAKEFLISGKNEINVA